MRTLFLALLVASVPTVLAAGAEPLELLNKMDGFRKEVPAPQTFSEQNGISITDVDGKDFLVSHLSGVARRLEVKTKAECLVLLTYLKDRDPKIRVIAATAIENTVQAYPHGMSLNDILEIDSDSHREMILRFVDKIDKLAAAPGAPPPDKKELSYPLRPSDREVLIKRIAKLEKGMTVKEALATLQPMRRFPKPVWNVPGNNSFTQDLGHDWSMRLNFANAADGGLLVSAEINPSVQQQRVPTPGK